MNYETIPLPLIAFFHIINPLRIDQRKGRLTMKQKQPTDTTIQKRLTYLKAVIFGFLLLIILYFLNTILLMGHPLVLGIAGLETTVIICTYLCIHEINELKAAINELKK